ncbi:aminoglycoside phosphotransferase family protein [Antrihabitans cavernicola]|nr:aminoglycoside phosphotransferase family protein [Spelaeibacter cavernicola]
MDRYDAPDAPRRGWVDALPDTLAMLVERWHLTDVGRPYQPGGVASWVAPVRDARGARAVLKVGWYHFEALHEADGLRAWDGNGAVRLVYSALIGDTNALLLEQCLPGRALSSETASVQDDVIVGLLSRLWIEPRPGHPFRPLQEMCDEWADEFEEKYAADPAFDRGMASAGMELFRELPSTADRAVLLCTDLHPDNILAAEREPWLVIDPKPYLGDPAYDVLQYMFDSRERLIADPFAFVRELAEPLALDRERLRLWLFARCVQEALDAPDLVQVAATLAP